MGMPGCVDADFDARLADVVFVPDADVAMQHPDIVTYLDGELRIEDVVIEYESDGV